MPQTPTAERKPLLHGPLLPIFLIVAVDVLGMTLILPLLPFYAEHLGANPTQVGLLVSTYAACQLVAGPILGRLSDQHGRRKLLLLSQAGTLAGFIMLAYAPTLAIVFLSRAIDGFTAGNLSLAQACITDVTEPQDRARAFGLIGIAFGLGFMVGPGVSGFLSQFGYVWPIFAACLLSATSILATFFLLPETRPAGATRASQRFRLLDWGAYTRYFRQRNLGNLLWQFFAYVFAFSMLMAGFALFAERRYTWEGKPFGPVEVGYVFAFMGLTGAVWQGGMGRLVKKLGEYRLVTWGLLAGAAGLLVLGFTFSVPALLAVIALVATATSVVRPALTSLITQQAGREEQGIVLGLTQSLMAVAQIVAPLIAGILIHRGELTMWAVGSGIALLIGWMLAISGSRNRAPAA